MTETNLMVGNPYLPHEVQVIERIQEVPDLFTLRLRFTDPARQQAYGFAPGQFNMLALHGVGEVPISIVSDPEDEHIIDHTIRAVGRVTHALSALQAGDRLGIRGPFGRGWPLHRIEGRDVVVVTGGLGCAPTVSVIRYILQRRASFGHLNIIQGVKHAADLIWREQYQRWAQAPDTTVLLAADQGDALWPWHVGLVTDLFEQAQFDRASGVAMMCGPEGMMRAAVARLGELGMSDDRQWLSMERNMQCAVGHCGHCQFGADFICKDGPVFPYSELRPLFGTPGF